MPLPGFEPRALFLQFEIHTPERNDENHDRPPNNDLWKEVPVVQTVNNTYCIDLLIGQTDSSLAAAAAAAGVSVISIESLRES